MRWPVILHVPDDQGPWPNRLDLVGAQVPAGPGALLATGRDEPWRARWPD